MAGHKTVESPGANDTESLCRHSVRWRRTRSGMPCSAGLDSSCQSRRGGSMDGDKRKTMRTPGPAAAFDARPFRPRYLMTGLLLILLAGASPALAQSFLGTIRGTVVDPQGGAVSGAAVLVVDEATGAVRNLDTDAEGRYEAAIIRPGMYRVEVV